MMERLTRIQQLAKTIYEGTEKINSHIQENHLPQPSFDIHGMPRVSYGSSGDEVEIARLNSIEACEELSQLLSGPFQLLSQMVPTASLSLHAIYHYKIATSFPLYEQVTFEDLSQRCGVDVIKLKQILRHAMAHHRLFCEPQKGVVAHTSVSRCLAENSTLQEWLGLMVAENSQSCSKTVEAMLKWPGSQEPNETGFSLSNNTKSPMYEELAKHPARMQRFTAAMSGITGSPPFDLEHLSKNYPWASLGAATVVDIGGADGRVGMHLHESFPDLQVIVQDLPSVVTSVNLPENHKGTIKLMAHNFLEPQPVDADIYLLRWILHNWSNKYCIKILRNMVSRMRSGTKILVMDLILPEPNSLPLLQERQARQLDLIMLPCFNSQERELSEWTALFKEADERFYLVSTTQPAGSALSILEFGWQS